MTINESDIISAKNNIADTIGRYIQLQRHGSEYRACCPFHEEKTPSFTVNEVKGFYHCFGCGASGDAIGFVMEYENKSFPDAVQTIVGTIGQSTTAPVPKAARKPQQQWTPIIAGAEAPESAFSHYRLGTPSKHYPYYTADRQLIGYVCRFDTDAGKETLPLCLATSDTGRTEWRWLGFKIPRTMYGLHNLAAYPSDAKIVLVEGEKSANAAQLIFKANPVLSWPGGVNGVKNTDWSPLAGRSVIMWPDNDDPGINAMRDIYGLIHSTSDVKIIPPPDHGKGWDLADDMPEGFSPLAYAKANMQQASVFFSVTPASEPPVTIDMDPQPVATTLLPDYLAVDYYTPLTDITPKGKPLQTLQNLSDVCSRLGVIPRYNVISKEVELIIPGSRYSVDNNTEASLAYLTSQCAKFSLPADKLKMFLVELSDQNQFNPVKAWIESASWDGTDRLAALNSSLSAVDPVLSATLLTKWMVGAVEAIYNPSGISNSSVLVLQGPQYSGKTAWFWSLTGGNKQLAREGVTLNPSDKDSVMGAIQYWLVELGELDATFRKADIANLKAFITKDHDQIRRPYAAGFSNYPRRTVFCASVNPRHYLHDETGNRRFWTIECTEGLNPFHGINMQQAWAQVTMLHKSGHGWKLSREEMIALNSHNEEFSTTDPIEELIVSHYDPSDSLRTNRLTSTEVLLSIGYDRPNNAQAKSCSAILAKHFGQYNRTHKGRVFEMPMKKISL